MNILQERKKALIQTRSLCGITERKLGLGVSAVSFTAGHICPVCCISVSSSPDRAPDARPPPAPCNDKAALCETRQQACTSSSSSPSCAPELWGSGPAHTHPLSLASMSRTISSRWSTRETSSWRSSCSLCC